MTETCPVLLALLARHSRVVCAKEMFSACIISILRSGGEIYPHHGPTNLRLRLQYPLSLNEECRIYCGGQERDYKSGYEIIDDSYNHYAKNKCGPEVGVSRIMLVIDLWHPWITQDERFCINQLLSMSSATMGGMGD